MCVSGSAPAPGQLVPPAVVAIVNAAIGPSTLLTTPGRNIGPSLYRDTILRASALSSGVKSIRSSTRPDCRAYAGGLVGNGCVGDVFSPGTSDCGTGFSSIGHTGCPVTRSNTYSHPSLLGDATALIALPFTLMSSSSAADELSKFQIGWC